MKRIRIVYSLLIALLILSAFIGCSAPDKRSTAEKSGDCSLTVETVCGVAVKDSQAVLTSEQFSELANAADVSALCVYTAAEKADVVISLDAEELTFIVTAENGTENTYTVTIVVLSGDTSFTLRTFADIPVSSDHITVPEKIWRDMCADADLDILPYFTAETADGAVLKVEFDTKTRRAKFTCVSQDGTQTAVRSYGLQVSVPFGSHTQTGYGSRNSITWSYDHDSYVLSGATAFKDINGNALADDYAVSFRAALSGYKTDSEMCFAAYEAGNLMIRFYIRVVDSDYISVRTDYRDRSDYKNEILLINKIPYSGGMFSDIKLIVKNNSLVIVYEGETLFRRTLFGLKRTEACIYSNNCTVYLKNIETESDPESVAAQYENALDGYDESDIGKTLIGSGENMERMEEGPNGEIIRRSRYGRAVQRRRTGRRIRVCGRRQSSHYRYQNVGRIGEQSGISNIQIVQRLRQVPFVQVPDKQFFLYLSYCQRKRIYIFIRHSKQHDAHAVGRHLRSRICFCLRSRSVGNLLKRRQRAFAGFYTCLLIGNRLGIYRLRICK